MNKRTIIRNEWFHSVRDKDKRDKNIWCFLVSILWEYMLIEEVTFMAEVGGFSIHSARQVISRTILFAEQVPTIGHCFLHFLLVVKDHWKGKQLYSWKYPRNFREEQSIHNPYFQDQTFLWTLLNVNMKSTYLKILLGNILLSLIGKVSLIALPSVSHLIPSGGPSEGRLHY